MPVEATFVGSGTLHPYLVVGTEGLVYGPDDEGLEPRPPEGELMFLPDHRNIILYTVTEEEIERAGGDE